MKRKLAITLILFFAVVMALLFAPAVSKVEQTALAQKQKAAISAVDIDSSIAPLTGKRVMYVLTDEEGGSYLESTGQGRKVPAIISYNYRTLRNASGNLVSPLTIFRPASIGGLLLKDEVPSDSSRSPGSWDNFQPGDLRN
jgi:hypothetical protein